MDPARGPEVELPEPPRGALLLTVLYLLVLAGLWLNVFLRLVARGGILP